MLGGRLSFLRPAVVALWFAFLLLPFKGLKASAILFAVVAASVPVFRLVSGLMRKVSLPAGVLQRYLPRDTRYFALILIPVALLPLVADNYVLDVLIMSGIYIILALGLNVVVGFTGLLNLGFVAFYAVGAYSYAVLNTMLGLGFWSAMPAALALTTLSGFLLAVPALRLRGDYLAIVTLGFGEIVRLVLNNWDSFTNGPNGISGIASPSVAGVSLGGLSRYYYLVACLVVITVFVIGRVKDSKIGRAWIAIREDEIASSSMGINTTAYKLSSSAFGAFWAGLAGCLFAAKMRFVSPESFTFMESVLILCMVIVGGLGSIAGVIVGAVLLVTLPEVLREVQMYRMLALGSGLVFLMIFRPQGLFGGKGVSS
jgi:branched-chain amino acid transport system permease protein